MTPRMYRFTDSHKSEEVYPKRHPLMAVREGTRDLSMEAELQERDGLLALIDHDPIVRIDLSPEGVEFLLDTLPEDDYFTQSLRYARDVARFKLWDRAR